jgi:hypothetical protein
LKSSCVPASVKHVDGRKQVLQDSKNYL